VPDTILHISTNIQSGCRLCRESIPHGDRYFQAMVNHMTGAHGYKILHVGPETSHGDNGPWHTTVAVLQAPA
jgi:hypothetical protein